MAKKDGVIEIEGTVVEALPNAMFRVELRTATRSSPTSPARCGSTTSGSSPRTGWWWSSAPYDLSRGRIVYRYK